MLAITVPASVLAWWVGDVLAGFQLASWQRALPVAVAAAAGLAFVVVVGRLAGVAEFEVSAASAIRRLRRR